ncbi:MAG TPA: hypothetical protein VFP17_08600, partial [Solirubrobacterales bacterium]|nr:hypothetical protein [Solirubrobacterales bacterium]
MEATAPRIGVVGGGVLGEGEAGDRRPGPRLDAELARPRHHRVDQPLVAADDMAHFLAALAA